MSLKEVPSDHDFFDPAYVKQWTDSIIRYRPERQQLFKVFAAEAARINKASLPVFALGCGPGFLAEALLKTVRARATRSSTSRRRCWSLAGVAWRGSKTGRFLFSWISKRTIGPWRFPPASI